MTDENALAASVEAAVPVENVNTAPPSADVAQTPAPDAAPEINAEAAAATPSDVPETPERPRNRVQERIEELARENRRLRDEMRLRELLAQQQATPATQAPAVDESPKPRLEEFGYDQEKWADAIADWSSRKAETAVLARFERQQVERAETQRRQAAIESFREAESKFSTSVDDYADVVYNPRNRITDAMVEAISASPVGPQIAYHLAKTGKDREIAALPAVLQGRAIALLESQFSARPAPSVSRAAPPPKPLSSGSPTGTNPDPYTRTDISDAEAVALIRAEIAQRHQLRR